MLRTKIFTFFVLAAFWENGLTYPSSNKGKQVIRLPVNYKIYHHHNIEKVPIVIKKHLHYHIDEGKKKETHTFYHDEPKGPSFKEVFHHDHFHQIEEEEEPQFDFKEIHANRPTKSSNRKPSGWKISSGKGRKTLGWKGIPTFFSDFPKQIDFKEFEKIKPSKQPTSFHGLSDFDESSFHQFKFPKIPKAKPEVIQNYSFKPHLSIVGDFDEDEEYHFDNKFGQHSFGHYYEVHEDTDDHEESQEQEHEEEFETDHGFE